MKEQIRVLSCVPKQLYTTKEKLKWIETACEEYAPDIFVTPQEFFGGAYIMPDQKAFKRQSILPTFQKIAEKFQCAMIIGIVESHQICNQEAIWFIDEKGEYQGEVYKIALPRYDHINTKGYGNIEPETDIRNRFRTFIIQGMQVSAIFCWEVFSDILWTGLALCKPDLIFSMIKFGVNSWPQVKKDNQVNIIKGFGYGCWPKPGKQEIWLERLYVANKWQVKCPIVCSTNSWELRPISMPLCGTISTIPGQAKDTLWTTDRSMKKIPEKIVVDELNPLAIRSVLQNKFIYKDLVGEFPPFSLGEFTMMLKINRLQDRLLTGREKISVQKEKNKRREGFDLYDGQ